MPSFWDVQATAERQRFDTWQDVEPALCASCATVKRGVLLGVCADCLEVHDGRSALRHRAGA